MVPRERLETPDLLARRVHLATRAVQDLLVQWVVQVNQAVRVRLGLPDLLVRWVSLERLVPRVTVDPLGLLELPDKSDLQVKQDHQDLWVRQDLPETQGLLVLREIKDQLDHKAFQDHPVPKETLVPLERRDPMVLLDFLEHQDLRDHQVLLDHQERRVLPDRTEFPDWLVQTVLRALREIPDLLEMQARRDHRVLKDQLDQLEMWGKLELMDQMELRDSLVAPDHPELKVHLDQQEVLALRDNRVVREPQDQ